MEGRLDVRGWRRWGWDFLNHRGTEGTVREELKETVLLSTIQWVVKALVRSGWRSVEWPVRGFSRMERDLAWTT